LVGKAEAHMPRRELTSRFSRFDVNQVALSPFAIANTASIAQSSFFQRRGKIARVEAVCACVNF
jgi:hypothetical protein